jgi:hypothetical protein
VGDTTSLVPGYPIRTSSDPRSVDSSPRHNAASHVLHRLPVPRHPPCALKHLQHKTKKLSHSPHKGDEIFRNCTSTPRPKGLAARCSQPLSTNQTPHPTTKDRATTKPTPTGEAVTPPVPHEQGEEVTGLLSQSPIVCLAVPSPAISRAGSDVCCAPTDTHYRRRH